MFQSAPACERTTCFPGSPWPAPAVSIRAIAPEPAFERPEASTPPEPVPEVAVVRFVPCFREERIDADGIKWRAVLPKAVRDAVKWIAALGEPVRLEAKCDHLVPAEGDPATQGWRHGRMARPL
jgi:hypothetical protein